MKARLKHLAWVCVGLILVIGAVAPRTPLLRAYLQSNLDGNAYSITNLGDITIAGAITMSGGTNLVQFEDTNNIPIGWINYSGVMTVNGSGITNLNGTNVQSGTINSNALDTATKAMLGGTAGALTNNETRNVALLGSNYLAKAVTTNITVTGTGTNVFGASVFTNFLSVTGTGTNVFGESIFTNNVFVTNTVTATNFVLRTPQWIDMIGSVLPGSGVAEPAATAITNGSLIKVPGFQLADEENYAIQMPHNIAVTNASFVVGTNVNQWHAEPHIHFMLSGATVDATHSNVTWQIEWAVSEINGDIKAQGTNTAVKGVTVNGRHYYAEFGPITNGAPWGISSMFNARLSRQSSASQELAPNGSTRDVVRLKFDLHVPIGNSVILGSRGETSQ